ncbi:MAG: ABC transporter ATP-binding protein [Deltaproteobacteria bacterium]|nr:ABC transporter ATP-binding protein [Deltaproteobacteria bacterium]
MIKIRDLKKSFKTKIVLDGVNLDIEKGKITVIIGRSGEGKSVFIKHIIGLIKPDSGHIYLDDKDIVSLSESEHSSILKRFGMLFQGAALFDSMTVAENVGFPLREHTGLSSKDILTTVKEKLRRVGLVGIEDLMPAELSGGMKKRVGLARAIIMDPEVVIFDEPTTGLDPVMSANIGELMLDTQKALKTTYIAITHDIALTFRVADYVAMLHEGRIIAEGTVEEIKNNPNPILQQFLTGSTKGPLQVT